MADEITHENESEEVNALELSDEEFERLDEAGELPDEVETIDEEEDTVDPEEADEVDEPDLDGDADIEPEVDEEDSESLDADNDNDDEGEPEDDDPETADDADIDYKQAYADLMAPFKANGAEITVKGIEDQRRLMKMGANYEAKMNGIKPVRVLQKTLEEASIINSDGKIDQDRLNHLLDLDRGDPEAVKALMKRIEMDPMDVDLDEVNYTPQNHVADEGQIEFDEVIKELEGSESFGSTADVITNQWDKQSRDFFFENPGAMRDLNADIADGVFENINNIVQSEKVQGRLKGMSDIQAYISVVRSIDEQNAQPDDSPEQRGQVRKADKSSAKRKAASISKSRGKSKPAVINPLQMSDEEFEKLYGAE